MSDEYLIDGYNLLHALGLPPGPLGPRGLEKLRERLLDQIAAANRAVPADITVVFDASRPPRQGGVEQDHDGVRVLFAVKHDEADALIEELIRKHASPRRLRIVSDDHRLQRAARRRRAQVVSCGEFLDGLEAALHSSSRRESGERGETGPLTPNPSPPQSRGRGGRKKRISSDSDEKEGQAELDRSQWEREFGDIARDPTLKDLFDTFGADEE